MNTLPTTNNISRREVIAGAALGAALLVSGCSAPTQDQPTEAQVSSEDSTEELFDLEKAYLPIGSVVLVDGFPGHMAIMIVGRRPRVSTNPEDHVPDYAGMYFPFGMRSALAEDASKGDVIAFDTEHITKVLFVGFQDVLEKEAQAELQLGRGTNETCVTLLAPLTDSYFNVHGIIEAAKQPQDVKEDDAQQ